MFDTEEVPSFEADFLLIIKMSPNQYTEFQKSNEINVEMFIMEDNFINVSIPIARMNNETETTFFCNDELIDELYRFVISQQIKKSDGIFRLQFTSEWDCRTFDVSLKFIKIVNKMNFPFVIDYVFLIGGIDGLDN